MNARGELRVARSSRALVLASRQDELFSRTETGLRVCHAGASESSSRRDTSTNARDERATRSSLRAHRFTSTNL